MKNSKKTIDIKVEGTIPAPLDEVFDGWLDPKIPGNPWDAAEKFILDPRSMGSSTGPSRARPTTADLSKSSDPVEFSIPGYHPTPWERNQ